MRLCSVPVLSAIGLCFASIVTADTSPVCMVPHCTGEVLVSARGVPACSNAPVQGKTTTCGQEGPFGLEFQCVEYIRRYYHTVFGINTSTTWWASRNAVDFFDPNSDGFNTDPAHELIGFKNRATTVAPAPDDILVFGASTDGRDPYGHVAIVQAVVGNQVYLAEENYPATYPTYLVASQDSMGIWSIPPRGALPIAGWLRLKQAIPSPSLLRQLSYNGGSLPLGGTTNAETIAFQGLVSDPSGELVRLEVEVQPASSPFTGSPTYATGFVSSGSLATKCVLGIGDGDYHWRARTMSASKQASPWIAFNPNSNSTADFSVQATVCAPCAAGSNYNAVVTPKPSGSCSSPLAVSLIASPASGAAPLNSVSFTASVSGLSAGTINYTFYCDRPDAGTDITTGYAGKVDSTFTNPLTEVGLCSYTAPGVYTAKVIAENGSGATEARVAITVNEVPAITAPRVTTLGATGVLQSSATLNLLVMPNGIGTSAWFDWGTSATFCCSTPAQYMGPGTVSIPLSVPIASLMCSTTYYFRGHAQNGVGDDIVGGTLSFTTGTCGSSGVLMVAVGGTGTGTVWSNPVGINCPGTCSATFAPGTQVTLSPSPSPGSTFAGWSGDPACASGSVIMNGNYACTAVFSATAAAYTLTVGESGSGTVTSSDGGVNCGVTCAHTYVAGTTVILTASAASGWSFSSWSGNCSGGPVVQLGMNSNLACTANFTQNAQPTPVTTTGAATNVTATSATLNGTINPENFAATAYFEYGPDPNLGNATPGILFGPGNNSFFPYAQTVTGLACATTYRFRAVGVGAGGDYIASNNTFMTAQCPPAPCYALNLIANGDAPAPIPSPANASGCPNGQYHAGDHIALTVVLVSGDVVTGWGGTDNDTSTATTNTVTMNFPYNRAVYVIEQHICYHLSLGYIGQGSAPVTTNPVAYCPPDYFPWGYEVDASGASPATNWQIGGWSGTEYDYSQLDHNFVLMPQQNTTALVQYTPIPYPLIVEKLGNGTGTVTSDVPGIDCGATCSTTYPYGTTVTLTATPDPGSTFLGFSGGVCNGGVPTITAYTVCTVVFGLAPNPASSFHTLTPCRVVDTRSSGHALGAMSGVTVPVAGYCGVPGTAKAVAINVTAVGPSAPGFLTVYPAVGVPPSTWTVAFRAGTTRAASTIVGLSPSGTLTMFNSMTAGQTNFLIDVTGYFQ